MSVFFLKLSNLLTLYLSNYYKRIDNLFVVVDLRLGTAIQGLVFMKVLSEQTLQSRLGRRSDPSPRTFHLKHTIVIRRDLGRLRQVNVRMGGPMEGSTGNLIDYDVYTVSQTGYRVVSHNTLVFSRTYFT